MPQNELEGRFLLFSPEESSQIEKWMDTVMHHSYRHPESISCSMKSELKVGHLGKQRKNHLFFVGAVTLKGLS